jgi:Ca2+-binding EF-hand superfamily protein
MKIASENAALALSQANATSGAAQKRRAAEDIEVKAKVAANERTVVDTVELSEAKPVAQKSRVDAQIPTETPSATETPATPADPLAELLSSFGQRAGDDGFNSALDANGDGVINFADLNAILNKLNGDDATPPTGGPLPVDPDPLAASPASITDDPTSEVPPVDGDTEIGAVGQPPSTTEDTDEPASFTAVDIDRLLGSFGAQTGGEGFISEYDFDNDGVINFGDLNALLSRISGDAGVQQQTLLDQLTERIGSSKGDERFNPSLDFDNDGIINFGDLNTLLTNLAQSRSAND